MTNRDRILDYIQKLPGRDDDEIAVALGISHRQAVNAACRQLEKARVISRRTGAKGKLVNYPVPQGKQPVQPQAQPTEQRAIEASLLGPTQDWFWEGNVCHSLARHLVTKGWTLLSMADTKTRQQGVDLHLQMGGRELVIEAKGYPSDQYRDPSKRGQKKPTNPSMQAGHWYAHALLKAICLQKDYPHAQVAMAFPDYSKYRALYDKTRHVLDAAKIAVLFIVETGEVEAFSLTE